MQHVEWFWRQTLLCDGSESSLEQCRYRLNYNLEQCLIERQYVFVRCGKRNLPEEYNYWGNVRFATPNVESAAVMPGYSSLDYVDIYGAGILHGDRVAAVQVSHLNSFVKPPPQMRGLYMVLVRYSKGLQL